MADMIKKRVCNSCTLFRGNFANQELNYSQKTVTYLYPFQSISIDNNASRDLPTVDAIEVKATVVVFNVNYSIKYNLELQKSEIMRQVIITESLG